MKSPFTGLVRSGRFVQNASRDLVLGSVLRIADLVTYLPSSALNSLKIALLRHAGVRIDGYSLIDRGFRCLQPSNIRIGKHVSMGHDCCIWAFTPVKIGSYTLIAKDLLIVSASHDIASFEPAADQQVEIGAGCWIGARVTILGGSRVGRGCVIGAGALVRGELPDWSIAVGVPARVIRQRKPAARIWNPLGHYTLQELLEAD